MFVSQGLHANQAGRVSWLMIGLCGTLLMVPAKAQSVRLSSVDLKQGDLLVVWVESDLELEGWIGQSKLDFARSPQKGHGWALWGVDMDEPPGQRELVVRVGRNGPKLVKPFKVLQRSFESEEITVPTRFTEPTPELVRRMETERKELERVLDRKSSIPLWRGRFEVPSRSTVTSPFGTRRTFNASLLSRHLGVDFRAEEGAEIGAPNGGQVVFAAEHYLTGKTLVLDHGLGLHSIFIHLSSFEVDEGHRVSKGDLIARAGSTGRTTAPHLHWSVRLSGARVDPLALIRLEGVPED